MSLLRRLLQRPVKQFPERLVQRVVRESTALGGLAGQLGQGFDNGIHLDFANDFHYIKSPGQDPQIAPFTSLFTFTGDNLSMYRGANGLLRASVTNTPRIEYDANGRCLGLLIEGARTNLCLRSQDFATSWTNGGTTDSTNTITAPDGTLTADTLIEDGSTGLQHNIRQAITITADATHTFSVFVKAKERTKGALRFIDNASAAIGCQVFFDLTAGTLNNGGALSTGTYTSSSITPYANGWYRVTLTGAIGGGVTAARVQINIAITDGDIDHDGDNASGIYVWGAQLEQAVFASSYIPTTTASQARAADSVFRNVGTEVSAAIGTLFGVCDTQDLTSTNARFLILDGGDGNNRFGIRNANGGFGSAFSFGATVGDGSAIVGNTYVASELFKVAAALSTNDLAISVKGNTVATDNSLTSPLSLTRFFLGADPSGGTGLFGHILRADYWPERKPNSELQRLTS